MVCIPAVLQGISNPVPEIELPEWLQKKTFDMKHHRQQKLLGFIQPKITPQRIDLSKKKEPLTIEKDKANNNSNHGRSPAENLNFHQTNKFSMKNNFKAWLGEQKKLWREKKLDVNP